MALQPLSIGDILMMSQTAWKIGRAFTQGRKSAPSEFAEVEREANGLSDALKLTAESLHADGSILNRAEPELRGAVNAILESAGRTLGDLESFVERYQVIKKRENRGGFVVERSWSDVIVANYKTFKWTTEGGDITELRNMLNMHTNTINITMQALQSRSLARLEKTVIPMADRVASIHDRVNGDLGRKIDDLHGIIMTIVNSTPSLVAIDRLIDNGGDINNNTNRVSGSSTYSTPDPAALQDASPPRMLEPLPPRSSSYGLPTRRQDPAPPRDSVLSTPTLKSAAPSPRPNRDNARQSLVPLSTDREPSNMEWDFETGRPVDRIESAGGSLGSVPMSSPAKSSALSSSPGSFYWEASMPRRESFTLPDTVSELDEDYAMPGSSRDAELHHARHVSFDRPVSPVSPLPRSKRTSLRSSNGADMLPPPAMSPDSPHQSRNLPATPSSFFGPPKRTKSESSQHRPVSRPQTARSVKTDLAAAASSPVIAARKQAFERSLFRNAAILCDVRGTLTEYAQHLPDEPDPRYNTEMVAACTEARVCVIRKRENRAHGGTTVVTSIWVLSDDGGVRCQQKLPEAAETVPYCSYFQPEKVSIPPAAGDITLRFHGEHWTDDPAREVKTNWVNYLFASEGDAVQFQSAVFGRLLIRTFRTLKTIVIHEGLKGAFAFEEQFANIETLRLWEDDGVCTPGAQGGVLALMHISSNFGEGWARWWMNSSKQPVRVKGENWKHLKMKGMDVAVVKPGSGASRIDRLRSPSTAGGGLQRVETGFSDGASVVGVGGGGGKAAMGPPPAASFSGKKSPIKKVTGVKIEFKEDEERNKFLEMTRAVQEKMLPLPDP